ncbi:putative GRIP and coiled-coil domain-containing protein [Quillaja saponaria]|uniref:GRIP and coiled-coil domain-containing protein n=1 Tax=Quillaja saponaria TaxID=32244 RepID=A0AAD7Q1S5_QUISA|nr:putative GRIP and coiled-coil domain-containing protein [Quillaja saponaria]
MATEIVAADHISSTDEKVEKQIDEEVKSIEQNIGSSSLENEEKYDKAAEEQSQANPSSISKGEGEGEGEDTKEAEPAFVELDETNGDDTKEDEKAEAPSSVPLSKSEGGDEKAEPAAVEVEKIDDAAAKGDDKDVEGPIPATLISKSEGKAEGEDKKDKPAVVEIEKANDASTEDDTAVEGENPAPVVSKLNGEGEGEGEGEDNTTEPAAVEVEKADGAPAKGDDKVAEGPNPETLVSKLGVDNKTEPAEVEVEKADNDAAPVLDVYVGDKLDQEEEPIPDSRATSVTEPVSGVIKSQPEELLATESTAKEISVEPEKETTDKEEDNPTKTIDIPESSDEIIEKPSDMVEINTLTEYAKVVKETETSEAGSAKVEKPEPDVKEKLGEPESIEKEEEQQQPKDISDKPSDGDIEVDPHKELDVQVVKEAGNSKSESAVTDVEEIVEQSELAEQVEGKSKDTEIKEIPVGETAKVERSLTEVVDDTKLLKEEQTFKKEETSEIKNWEEVSTKEAESVLKNEAEQVSVNEETQIDPKEDEGNSSLPNVEPKVDSKIDDKIEPGDLNPVEGNVVKTENTEEANKEGTEKTEDNIKETIPVAVSNKTLDEVTTAINESVKEEPPKFKLEVKGEETDETYIAKNNLQNAEQPTKDSDNTKSSEKPPKEVSAKPTQKQSNTILSKFKQSLVKAKKAITGKSPTSRTISTDAKGDIEVK